MSKHFFKGAFFVLNKAILHFPLYLKFMIDWTKCLKFAYNFKLLRSRI